MKTSGLLSALLAISVLYACTDVKSLSREDYVERPNVNLGIDWDNSGVDASARPDSLSVMLCRLVNLNHKWLRCPSEGFGPLDTLSLPCGEWIGIALDEHLSNVKYSGLKEFRSSDSTAVKDIVASVDTLTYAEILSSRGAVDTNPSLPVYKTVDRLVCGYRRLSVDGKVGADNSAIFEMQDLSAPVSFIFDIKTASNVEVLSVLGEISGVPGEVDIMSRETAAYRSGRCLFDFIPSNVNETENLTKWKGSVGLLGIVPPEDGSTLLGDGILTVRVKVLSSGSEKIYIASMNLKSVLEENPILKITDRYKVYCRAVSGAMEYTLSSVLHLTEDGVEPEQGAGVGAWVNQAKIDRGI